MIRLLFGLTSGTAPSVFVMPGRLIELETSPGVWLDVTADVRRDRGVVMQHGIQGSGPSDRVATPPEASFVLDNSAGNSAGLLGRYSLYHASKLPGLTLGMGCRIQLQDPNSSDWFVCFLGRVDELRPVAGQHGSRQTYLVAKGWANEAERWNLTPDIGEQIGKRWEEIATAIIGQMSIAPFSLDFDEGGNAFPYALDTSSNVGQSAQAEFAKLARSEFGYIYEKADGTLRLEGRHARLMNTSVVWTLTDTDLQDLSLPSSRDEIINSVLVTTHPKIITPEPPLPADTVVYRQANTIDLDIGETKLLLGPYRDQVTGETIGATEIQPQVAGVDYTANTLADGTGSDETDQVSIVVTAGASGAKFSVTNSAGIRVTLLSNVLKGRAILDRGTTQHAARDTVSIAANRVENVVNLDMDYQANDIVGQGAADYTLAKYADPFAQAQTARIIARTPAQVAQLLRRDVSDRVALSETVTGVANEFFINGITLSLRPDGYLEGTYTFAPAMDPFSGLYWVLGTSVLGTDTVPAPF